MKRVLILTILLVSYVSAFSQLRSPKYSNEFLALGVGARALAMANTQTGLTSDVTSGYWNPAGLNEMTGTYEFSIMHSEYFGGIANYDYLGFAMRLDDQSALGATIIRLGVDDIPDTRFLYDANGALNYNNVRFFSAADYAFIISYSRGIKIGANEETAKVLNLGGNIKIVHRSVGQFANAWGFGLDLGARMNFGEWQTGVMLRDITGTFTAWNHNLSEVEDIYTSTGNVLPKNSVEVTLPRMIIGGARRFSLGNKFGILPAVDLVFTFDGQRNVLAAGNTVSLEPLFGLEFDFKEMAFLRAGVANIQQVKNFDGTQYTDWQPNMGVGFKFKSVQIDYALTDIGNQAEGLYSHVFSLLVKLDK